MSVRAYLVTIVTRLCIDHLDSAGHPSDVPGPWLPEPVAVDEPSSLEQSDSLSLAFLVLLEELTPPERAAYLLHDIFGYSSRRSPLHGAPARRLSSTGVPGR